jgi:hypothetical protein
MYHNNKRNRFVDNEESVWYAPDHEIIDNWI